MSRVIIHTDFMTLTFLKFSDQLFCRMLLIFGLFVFPPNYIQIVHFGRECHINNLRSRASSQRHMIPLCHIIGGMNFDHLVKVVPTQFFYSEITVFPYVIKD